MAEKSLQIPFPLFLKESVRAAVGSWVILLFVLPLGQLLCQFLYDRVDTFRTSLHQAARKECIGFQQQIKLFNP